MLKLPRTPPETPLINGAIAICRKLREDGHESYFAGGCVRDWFLGRNVADIDIATSARPEQVEALFNRTIPVGKAFGVIQVLVEQGQYEVATFRFDGSYADGRRPEAVTFCSAREDAVRRDFTVNGMFYDPDAETVLDYVGGVQDLEKRIIRAIGDPATRFREDRLRMLRAVRFATTLDFAMSPETHDAIPQHARHIVDVSPERIGREILRSLCEAQRAGDVLRLLDDTGLLNELFPELQALKGCEQPPEFHPEGDVWTHTLMMLDALPANPDPVLAFAVLMHDVGKPPTYMLGSWPDGRPRIRFNRHAEVGAEIAGRILQRLRLPRKMSEDVLALIGHHMRIADAPEMRRAKLRRLLGRETFWLELELHRLDIQSSHRDTTILDFLRNAQKEFQNEPALPSPWVNGRDLIAMGVQPGPALGKLLKRAYDRQLAGESTDRDTLLQWLRDELRKQEN